MKFIFNKILSFFGVGIVRISTLSAMQMKLEEHVVISQKMAKNILELGEELVRYKLNFENVIEDIQSVRQFQKIQKDVNDSAGSFFAELVQNIEILKRGAEKIDSVYANTMMLPENIEMLKRAAEKTDIISFNTDLLPYKIEAMRVAVLQNMMFEKWHVLDRLEEMKPLSFQRTCPICGHDVDGKAKKYITYCIFNGGKLVRRQCPSCSLIFGPEKMLALNDTELSKEYHYHYLGFNEGDSKLAELRSFYEMKPEKDGLYLNYGAGKWSESAIELRKEGYNVYSYDPYANEEGNPYFITKMSELSSMKFDGIFSHDLLEHLKNPIDELIFMGSILKDEGVMNHTTGCYNYMYEYTRFHLYFYLGMSKYILAEKAGFQIKEYIEDEEDKYYSAIFVKKT